MARQGLVCGLPMLKYEKDHLCSACAMGKSKKQSHNPKSEDTNQEKLYLLHMDVCRPMCVASVNGKRYILVIVDDYTQFTWVKFLASNDEAPDFIIKFLKMIQVRLNATVRNIRTDNGTEFVNQTLRDYYEQVGISHETSVVRTPQQNEESLDLEVGHMSNDPYFGIPIPETVSKESSSSNVIPTTVHSDAPISEHLIKPKTYEDALTKSCWIEAMQEELNEFEHLKVWELVPRPDKVMVITLKWIYKEEGINFEESFALVARLEAVRIFLAFAAHMNMTVYQMHVKTAFLNDILREEMSMMGKISFLLGLQISQSPRGIFLNQSKYALESLTKYKMESCDPVDTPMVEKSKLDEDPQGKAVNPTHYCGMVGTRTMVLKGFCYCTTSFVDVDHAGCQDTRHSTSGSMQLLGDRLVSWSSKRQKRAAISSTEVEYIALFGCCAQVLWMRSQLTDYGLGFNEIPMTEYQLADIFTKALCRERIKFLIDKLGMRSFTPETLKELANEAEE
ncbi:retrovirus-related pol polyprotein from transposon TNT 1-94 [Tanacetum coccineum]|uniref:Retrovirus-related pol polyprotein from transposon TNT 1-94 n=1 Tax=Tanacetum coccineum TaxID=301880 RepID=A0ABQ5IGU0_9ASTR